MSNITEVAQRAGVSKATVSRVINHEELVAEGTRARVLEAMAVLEYSPNSMARGLTLRRTWSVAVVTPGTASDYRRNLYYVDVLNGVRDQAAQFGYHVLLLGCIEKSPEGDVGRLIKEGRADGIVFVGARFTVGQLKSVSALGVPCVFVNRDYRGENILSVRVNVRQGMIEAVRYLVGLGHRRIAFMGNSTANPTVRERFEAYCSVVRSEGIRFESDLCPDVPDQGVIGPEDLAYEATRKLCGKTRFTAVVCANDYAAIGAYRALKESGLLIPTDVSVTGFDDIMLTRHLDPPLTTVRMPMYSMGTIAARLLIAQLRDRGRKPRNPVLDTELIVRSSCGPA
ncbi:MAG: LacI family DNA-binding transcriptional regulator [Firmicutes bacterium]|nr:LacI family DNA-binding transcriptional regulator [Bacillota bacterium]